MFSQVVAKIMNCVVDSAIFNCIDMSFSDKLSTPSFHSNILTCDYFRGHTRVYSMALNTLVSYYEDK